YPAADGNKYRRRVLRAQSAQSPSVPASFADHLVSLSTGPVTGTATLRPEETFSSFGEGRKCPRRLRATRTGDKENRGSFRCGFSSGFYRGPHPLSNELALLLTFASTVLPERQSPGSLPLR